MLVDVDTRFKLCTFKKAPIYFSMQPQSHLTALAATARLEHPAPSTFRLIAEGKLALTTPS